jgi:hypothetical protein
LTLNSLGESSTLIETRGDRAIWWDTQVTANSRITGIFSGDGFSPPIVVYEPPADQIMRGEGGYAGVYFFTLEGGTGDARFSNVLAYADGEVVRLTDNGLGWLADLRLPGFIPNYYGPDDPFPEPATIELVTTSGDRRDVIVVLLPDPVSAPFAGLLSMYVALSARARRRGAPATTRKQPPRCRPARRGRS